MRRIARFATRFPARYPHSNPICLTLPKNSRCVLSENSKPSPYVTISNTDSYALSVWVNTSGVARASVRVPTDGIRIAIVARKSKPVKSALVKRRQVIGATLISKCARQCSEQWPAPRSDLEEGVGHTTKNFSRALCRSFARLTFAPPPPPGDIGGPPDRRASPGFARDWKASPRLSADHWCVLRIAGQFGCAGVERRTGGLALSHGTSPQSANECI